MSDWDDRHEAHVAEAFGGVGRPHRQQSIFSGVEVKEVIFEG